MPWSSGEVIRVLLDHGWQLQRVKGSHHQYRHPTKGGTVTVPHPRKELPRGTLASIGRAAAISFGRNP
jgi:predicted RNA binding protein YcfA (HicA-like mRNA interferase family)